MKNKMKQKLKIEIMEFILELSKLHCERNIMKFQSSTTYARKSEVISKFKSKGYTDKDILNTIEYLINNKYIENYYKNIDVYYIPLVDNSQFL